MPTAARQVKVKAKGAAVQEPKSNAAAAPVIPITAVKNFGFSVAPKATITTGISLAARAPSILVSPVVEAEREIDAKYAQLGGAGGFLGQDRPLPATTARSPGGIGSSNSAEQVTRQSLSPHGRRHP